MCSCQDQLIKEFDLILNGKQPLAFVMVIHADQACAHGGGLGTTPGSGSVPQRPQCSHAALDLEILSYLERTF